MKLIITGFSPGAALMFNVCARRRALLPLLLLLVLRALISFDSNDAPDIVMSLLGIKCSCLVSRATAVARAKSLGSQRRRARCVPPSFLALIFGCV